ncbi:hypothetical protein AVEN_185335-1 [Araneus ventricosus]|uniref:Uncharacterized protein n=1 Tax=Araneus ventricosus TaxID=182803 RepID=A0A4Y2B597_ARAVE|nr:hypothetical protein AVEN_185335-1 [Araneus ventricosus]
MVSKGCIVNAKSAILLKRLHWLHKLIKLFWGIVEWDYKHSMRAPPVSSNPDPTTSCEKYRCDGVDSYTDAFLKSISLLMLRFCYDFLPTSGENAKQKSRKWLVRHRSIAGGMWALPSCHLCTSRTIFYR